MVSAADRVKKPARMSVWLSGKTMRARRPSDPGHPAGLDRERIIAASVRLLDAEGLAKFSMRRLAAELNVTAMSVYWYVDTKDDLLELALDSVFDELEVPDESADWRERLRAMAVAYRALLVRHTWMSPLLGTFLNIGPHSMRFSMAVQDIMRASGLSQRGQMGGLAAVFQFVYGFGTIEGHFVQRCASAGMTQDEYFQEAMGTIAAHPDAREVLAESTKLMEARVGDTVAEMREGDFAFALDILVAGIETMTRREAREEAR